MASKGKITFKTNRGVVSERCVFCGKFTGIDRNIPIEKRKYYVETAGQLCADCYAEIYEQSHNDNIIKL